MDQKKENKEQENKENREGQERNGPGQDFIDERRAVDNALNEKMKSQTESEKLDPRTANDPRNTEHDAGDSQKKTGRTKH